MHSATPDAVVDLIISVTKKPCDLVVCETGEIQDLTSCSCNAIEASIGELIEFATSTDSSVRLDFGDQFTFRDYSTDGVYAMAELNSLATYDCLTVVGTFSDLWNRFR